MSFLLRKCGYAITLFFDLFAKLGANFGIYATSKAMHRFNAWLAMIRTRTCSSTHHGERLGIAFEGRGGCRVVQKACKGRRTVVKRSSDSYAKVAQNPYQGRPTLMQRSSKNHAKVVQQFFKVRPTVTRRSPNTYGNVLQQFCKCHETVMQRSSHGYANVTNIMRRLANLHGGNLYSWVE